MSRVLAVFGALVIIVVKVVKVVIDGGVATRGLGIEVVAISLGGEMEGEAETEAIEPRRRS